MLGLLKRDICVGVVTAAGYVDRDGLKYYMRLSGLLEAVSRSTLQSRQKQNLVILGGECNYMFRFNDSSPTKLEWLEPESWQLDEMKLWDSRDIQQLLDIGETVLRNCISTLKLPAEILRKQRAVGIVQAAVGKFAREQLEETVLAVQRRLEYEEVTRRVPFCAFNGGSDVFVDIGDKRIGVLVLQRYFGNIQGAETLHVGKMMEVHRHVNLGDQFLSMGNNDYKARLACTTVWISSPAETVQLLHETMSHLDLEGR